MKFFLLMIISFSVIANNNNDNDPWEDTNRSIFEFNQELDENIFEPVARSYKENIPQDVQNRISDFSSNLDDVVTLGNEIAQFELFDSVNTLGRVVINSTIGLFGLFDVASDLGMNQTSEDFGETMALWGAPEGNYLVLPVVGPSTLRDTSAQVLVAYNVDKPTKKLNTTEDLAILTTMAIDRRAKLLFATDMLQNADDPYIAARSSYLQKREFDIYDGNIPNEEEDF